MKQSFALPEGEFEFEVEYGDDSKRKFAELKSKASAAGYKALLTGSVKECVLTLRKLDAGQKKLPRLPVIVALSTVAALIAASLLQQGVYQELEPSWPSYVTLVVFGATIAVILGVHELSQRLIARSRDAGHASSYLIPGIPFIPPFLPSLGFAASQRDAALNRDSLFDTVVAGPLALLAVAIILYAVGDVTAVQSAVAFSKTSLANTTVSISPSAIQLSVDYVLGGFLHPVASGYVAVSPVADGSTVGFILAFFAFLPMASYDGGILAMTAWGSRAARVASYLSVLALLALDTPNYWAVAIIALLLAGRPYQLKLQDEVSPLSTSRHWIFLGTIVLAFLCLPVPTNLGTFPLP